MNLKSMTPKFIRRILVLRDYRMTKATIRYLKNPNDGRMPVFEDLSKNHDSKMLRPKSFYKSMAEYYRNLLIQNEGRLEELQHEMKELGIPLE